MEPLIAAFLEGTLSAAEQERLRKWRLESSENEEMFQEFVRLWQLLETHEHTGRAASPPDPEELAARADVGWLRMNSARPHRRVAFPKRWRRAGAIAAVLAGGLLVGGLLSSEFYRRSQLRHDEIVRDAFITGTSEVATVRLRDGSVVRMAPRSRLQLIGNSASGREVQLDGRAYFAVARRENEPFRIQTGAGLITVLGTRFDLQADDSDMRLAVVEGRVALTAGGERSEVGAGEVAGVLAGTTLPPTKVEDVRALIDWVGDFVAFQETPLREVAAEIESRYGVTVVLSDSVLANRTITTWLTDRSLEEILQVICAVAVAKCSVEEGVVTIGPR